MRRRTRRSAQPLGRNRGTTLQLLSGSTVSTNFLSEITTLVEPVAGGWRYLFSSQFRARTREGWQHEHASYIVWDVFWGVLGIAVSLAVAGVLVSLAWRSATATVGG